MLESLFTIAVAALFALLCAPLWLFGAPALVMYLRARPAPDLDAALA